MTDLKHYRELFFLLFKPMLYNKTDIRIIIAPTIKVPNTINVIGIEKYLVSLKIAIKFIPNTMLVKIRINPGIPKYFNGCLIAICSTNDITTSPVCDIGFLVEVLPPVL